MNCPFKFVIGIDPGITGAIAILDQSGQIVNVYDMPSVPKGTSTKREVDPWPLYEIINSCSGNTYVIVEKARAMRKGKEGQTQGTVSSFNYGDTFGCIRSVCQISWANVDFIWPDKWKRYFSLMKQPKDASFDLAKSLFGSEYLTLKKHHNRAEAMLIALYGYKNL